MPYRTRALRTLLLQGLWCLVLACVPALAGAATCTWTGAAGTGLWADVGNWTPAPPGANDHVVLGVGAAVSRGVIDTTAYADLTCQGNALLSGTVLTLIQGIHQWTGVSTISCALQAGGDWQLLTEGGGQCEITAGIDLGSHGLTCAGAGILLLHGGISGAGGLTLIGPGQVSLSGASTYQGDTTLNGGECWMRSDVLAGSGAFGVSPHPVRIDGGCLVLDSPHFARDLVVGEHGGQLDARSSGRVLDGDITITSFAGGGLKGTYLNRSMRAVTSDDWRKRPEITGTRMDALIHFPDNAFGTPQERARFAIEGSDDNWDNFSVQWDGFLRVEHEGAVLFTQSDDGSRVWLDRNHDGVVELGEWGDNGWGTGHGAVLQAVQHRLHAGIYPIRIQYEDGGGGNSMQLFWEESAEAVATKTLTLVPTSDLLTTAAFTIGGDDYGEERGQTLTIHGAIHGQAAFAKIGSSTLLLTGDVTSLIGVQVQGGELGIARGLGSFAGGGGAGLTVAEQAHVELAGVNQLHELGGAGSVAIDAGRVDLDATNDLVFAGTLSGSGMLHKSGDGCVRLSGEVSCPVTCDSGMLILGDGRVLAAVHLQSPLSTAIELPLAISGARSLTGTITVPADAPPHLGFELGLGDVHGHWSQYPGLGELPPGVHAVHLMITDRDFLKGEPWSTRWESLDSRATRTILYFFCAAPSRAVVRIALQLQADESADELQPRLQEVATPGARGLTGERLEWRFRPEPFPHNPYDPESFTADALVTPPSGPSFTIPAFFAQDMRSIDRGDREDVVPTGQEAFVVRVRPQLPGTYHVVITAHWPGSPAVRYVMPDCEVGGSPWNDYVHVDATDPRFFAKGGAFFWPIGLNMRSVNDVRSQQTLNTSLTPDRGLLSYTAYLQRFAAAGGTAIEVWMAPWNLGLEWRGDWNGFYGQGRYNQLNAWRLDQLLDEAQRLGIHVNLVVSNHGQASEGADHEWENSPYNVVNGGRLTSAGSYFTDPWALQGQEAYRRYLVARYADHPAILGWKLWSEVNLTSAGPAVVSWHEHACARWHALDVYGHPITTHWAGDYGAVNREVAGLPGLDYICIDAYQQGRLLAQLLTDALLSGNGLARFHKPVLVTECGGNWNGAPAAELISEQASAPWASLVSGNAGSAMMWWYEFVDQHNLWQAYAAIHRFTNGEDLRGSDAASIPLSTDAAADVLWARAWSRPGRMLGYLLDGAWGKNGTDAPVHAQVHVDCGAIGAGSFALEWWDCMSGTVIQHQTITHAGGDLQLSVPSFSRHIAFKLQRL